MKTPRFWGRVKYLVPDGSYAPANQVVAEFEAEDLLAEQKIILQDQWISEARLVKQLADISNKVTSLNEQYSLLHDELKILISRENWLKSLPDEDEVKIAEEQMSVALLRYAAAQKELSRAKLRFDSQIISAFSYSNQFAGAEKLRNQYEYRKKLFEYSQLPASEFELGKISLQIANKKMDLEKVSTNLIQNKNISRLESRSARMRTEKEKKRLKEIEGKIATSKVLAPHSGFVMYTKALRDALTSGTKPFPEMAILKMPEMKTLIFRGQIPEQERRYFKEGDSVIIYNREGVQVKGILTLISKLSKDISEKKEGWDNGSKSDTGRKVYDVVITPAADAINVFRSGMNADGVVKAGKPFRAAYVPVSYVKIVDKKNYIAVNNVYEEVEGRFINNMFVLNENRFNGQQITFTGEMPKQKTEDLNKLGNVVFPGELQPLNSHSVTVGRIQGWQSVTWIAEEDINVKKGDVVALIDTTDIDKKIQQTELEIQSILNDIEHTKEKLKLMQAEGEFNLKKATNDLKIELYQFEIFKKGANYPSLLKYETDYENNKIDLSQAILSYKQISSFTNGSVSDSRIAKARLELTNLLLAQEKSKIILEKNKIQYNEVEHAKAKYKILIKRNEVELIQKDLSFNLRNLSNDLAEKKLNLEKSQSRLAKFILSKENFTIKSPSAGILRHNKVYSAGNIIKINTGSTVGSGFSIMEVANVSQMFVRVEILEKYYSYLKRGMSVKVAIPALNYRVLEGTIQEIEFLFENKMSQNENKGIYSSHEGLGETVFYAQIILKQSGNVSLKPGTMVNVYFNIEGNK